jgi:hypothetical protein
MSDWPDYRCTCIVQRCGNAHEPNACPNRGASNAGSVCRECFTLPPLPKPEDPFEKFREPQTR